MSEQTIINMGCHTVKVTKTSGNGTKVHNTEILVQDRMTTRFKAFAEDCAYDEVVSTIEDLQYQLENPSVDMCSNCDMCSGCDYLSPEEVDDNYIEKIEVEQEYITIEERLLVQDLCSTFSIVL